MRREVDESRCARRESRPPRDQSEREGVAGPEAALVVVRQELGLVRRHIDVYGAVALAAFARETEIERLLHVVVPPHPGHGVTFEHFPEQMGAAARRVLFLAGDLEARTHRPVIEAAAFA